jgi:hypothetical protein
LLKPTDPGKKELQMPMLSMPTLIGDQPQTLSSSHANSPYQTFLDLRSRPRRSTFGIEKKKDGGSSKLTPKGSERSEDAQDKTGTVLTNSGTSSASPNQLLRYGLHSKICLPAQYLLTTQIELGNYDRNATWFSNYSPEPRLTPRTLSCEELTQFRPLNAFKYTNSTCESAYQYGLQDQCIVELIEAVWNEYWPDTQQILEDGEITRYQERLPGDL